MKSYQILTDREINNEVVKVNKRIEIVKKLNENVNIIGKSIKNMGYLFKLFIYSFLGTLLLGTLVSFAFLIKIMVNIIW